MILMNLWKTLRITCNEVSFRHSCILWYIDGKSRLSDKAKEIIQNPDFVKFISIASLWEIAIKLSKDNERAEKLLLTQPFDALPEYIRINGFNYLSIQVEHLIQLKELPHIHGDPFDRLLISQAIFEDLTIVSTDKHFKNYPVKVIW